MTQEMKAPEPKDDGMRVGATIPMPNGKDVKFNLKPDQEPLATEDDTPLTSAEHIEADPEPPSLGAIVQKLGEMEQAIAIAMDGVSQAHYAIGRIGDEITAIVNLLVQRGIITVPDMKMAVANANGRRRMLINERRRRETQPDAPPATAPAAAPEPPAAPAAPAEQKEAGHDQAG